ncbi:uncharacterized protein BX663DRAFT_427060 [Cokeromyces recurvatus]|uniref:uncharacterized protein n=1 Tax=Cokeromyces recurvatus TaxID=90255 RepID=UPI00222115B5|nr:uncharacterized protein BX663DRAFT_427060 [Cokeromyces recurvatus]KAI7907158.1 hypothetical protein BX663DRAFT_427060 [Cokeromyces recurvatus]
MQQLNNEEFLGSLYTKEDACDATCEKQILRLFLIYCYFFTEDNYWKPYIKILPDIEFFEQYHILFNKSYVEGTSLEGAVHAKRAILEHELNDIQERDVSSSWLTKVELKMYLWADCILWSRALGFNTVNDVEVKLNIALVPFIDFANHSMSHSNIRWQLDATHDHLLLISTAPIIHVGDELLLSYGTDKSNQELLFIHGFCIEGNTERSCLTIPILPFLSHDQQKVAWLKQMNIKPVLKLKHRHRRRENDDMMQTGWDPTLILLMYLVALDEDFGLQFVSKKDGLELFLEDNLIKTLDELENTVVNHKDGIILPIIQLRVVLLLIDALEYQHKRITLITCNDSSILAQQASIYRREEKELIETSLEDLFSLQNHLMKDPIILAYLEESNKCY